MANLTLWDGVQYADVPAVQLPKTGGGFVTFYENVSMWKDKKVCIFGDSIGAGYGMTDNKSFVDILDEEGIFESVHKNCVSGSTSITWQRMLPTL